MAGRADLVGWLRDSTAISKHRDGTYGFFLGLLLVPFPLGLLAGGIADWLLARVLDARDRLASARALEPDARRRRRSLAIWLLRGIESRELLEGSATWDRMWRQLQRRNKYLYVRIRTKTGYEITGEVGDDSRVALSPQVQDLYVERVYRPIDAARPNGEMAPVEAGRGIYIRGSEIETVEFRGPAATIPAATSRSATT